jgi:Domain of unknown function (DUF5916)/Carbohydrate family 9 binding domain-like
VLTLALAAFQLAVTVPQVYNGRDGQTRLAPPRIEADVAIDGRLDEAVWQQAALLTGFSLYAPADGRPAPDSTEVRVWYSSAAIYFGIRAFEPHGPVTYTVADRDRVSMDDNVEIHLDTFNERNRALVFIVNPIGVQADGTKSEGGGFIPGANVAPGQNDLSADYVWQSKGVVVEGGYQVEIRIPFSSLRYRVGSAQTWGIQIDRRVQHSGYEETWTPAKRASASFISQAGHLTDLSGMHHGQIVEVNPEATNTVTGAPCCGTALAGWKYKSNPQFGGNVRWAIGSNVVLNGTVKPDFSQVEADATQIAADERFALFYAEKRPFFVEGSDQFNVPNSLVYTRAIVRPDGAVKLTGKLGNADVAVLSAVDEGQTSTNGERPLVDIVRLRQRIGAQSQAGILYSDRVGGGHENRVVGGDTKIVFGGKYYAQFQAVESMTRVNGVARSGPMWEAVLDGTGRSYGFHYNIIGIDPSFRADNGFVPRTDYVQSSASNRFTWYGRPGGLFERFNVFATVNSLWLYDDFFSANSLLEDHASTQLQMTMRGGWSVGLSPKISTYAFDPSSYANLYVAPGSAGGPAAAFVPSDRVETLTSGFTLSTPQFPKFNASVGATLGRDVDFLETSRVNRVDYNASLDLRPSSRLRVSATYVSSTLARRVDDARTTFTKIPRVKIEYQIARPIFIRLVSQYTANLREPLRDPRTGTVLLVGEPGSLAPAAQSVSNSLRTDWLFSYRPTPGTVFFLGYGGNLNETDPLAFRELRRTNDSFFMKASYVFR